MLSKTIIVDQKYKLLINHEHNLKEILNLYQDLIFTSKRNFIIIIQSITKSDKSKKKNLHYNILKNSKLEITNTISIYDYVSLSFLFY